MCPRKSDSSQSSANNRLTNSFIREGATKVRRFPRRKVRGVETWPKQIGAPLGKLSP